MEWISIAFLKAGATELGKELGKTIGAALFQGLAGGIANILFALGGTAATNKAVSNDSLRRLAVIAVDGVKAEIFVMLLSASVTTAIATLVWGVLSFMISVQDPEEAIRKPRFLWFLGLGITLALVGGIVAGSLVRIRAQAELPVATTFALVLAMAVTVSVIFWLGSVLPSRRALRAGLPFGRLLLAMP